MLFKKIFVFNICWLGLCWGQYDPSDVSVCVGGWGIGDSTSGLMSDITFFDVDSTISQTCTVTDITVQMKRMSGQIASSVRIKILSESGGTYTVEEDIDITGEFNTLLDNGSEQFICKKGE